MRLLGPLLCGALLTSLALAAAAALPHRAQQQPASFADAGAATAACKALATPERGVTFAQLRDAPTTINSARIVPAGGTHGVADDDLPEICRVEGMIAPTTGFLVRMPTADWNGKFMMGGCGGPCGNYLEDRIDQALVRNYAVVTTDMGHKGNGWLFAYNNPQGQVDFAWRATHLTAKVAKEVVAAFYGARASRNYFFGCSTGGRQAMIEAQRFPEDFDGIVAGAPVYDEIGDAPYFLEWSTLANRAPDGSTILTAPALKVLHGAVLAKCDRLDGLKDGLLMNPAKCAFDPKTAVCKPGADPATCLTAAQADVAQKIHDGARNSRGDKLYFGMPWGSEDQWINYFGWVNPTGKQTILAGQSITGYLAFGVSPPGGPTYKITDFDYDRDPPRVAAASAIYDPKNPDLSAFKARGGKLILFTGWNDNNIPADATVDYYRKATLANGGPAATRDFFRLFMLPGVNHCRGGAGGGEADWITALENWVERGQAPDQVIAMRPIKPYPTAPRALEDYGTTYSKFGRHPLPAGSYDTARPVYAWPAWARYDGRGDPAKPESWRRVAD